MATAAPSLYFILIDDGVISNNALSERSSRSANYYTWGIITHGWPSSFSSILYVLSSTGKWLTLIQSSHGIKFQPAFCALILVSSVGKRGTCGFQVRNWTPRESFVACVSQVAIRKTNSKPGWCQLVAGNRRSSQSALIRAALRNGGALGWSYVGSAVCNEVSFPNYYFFCFRLL